MAEEHKDVKRVIAKKVFVSDILNSTYIKRTGWEPSGILTRYGEVSRVDVMGIIVSFSKEERTIILDDGSGNITIRAFDNSEMLEGLSLGMLIDVIGRPRELNNSKYIFLEIVKKIEDKRWYKARQLELKLQSKSAIKLPVQADEPNAELSEIGPYQQILNSIASLDKGSGVDVQDIINHVKVDNSEKIINSLIEEGEIFEISPGVVKLLE
jgi:RPA family protein